MSEDDMHDVLEARYEKQTRDAQASDHDNEGTTDTDGKKMNEEEAMKVYMDDIQKDS